MAHDAKIGNNVIIANCGAIAGHCVIEDDVIIGGLSGIHQFVRIDVAIIGAVTMVTNDVILGWYRAQEVLWMELI